MSAIRNPRDDEQRFQHKMDRHRRTGVNPIVNR